MTQLTTPAGTRSHKVQVLGDVLLVNHERNPAEPDAATWSAGMRVYDISRPEAPKETAFLPTPGKGVHRITYHDERYAYLSGSDEGYSDQFLIIVDMTDPARPVEAGRWWSPGMHTGGGESPSWPPHRRHAHHHALTRGDRAYATWWEAGVYILDISDVSDPSVVAHLDFGEQVSGCTHTALPVPGRDLLVVVDEATTSGGDAIPKHARIVDIANEAEPRVVSTLPVPTGDHRRRGGRFGPPNLHEMRPGTFRSSRVLHMTYFNAGLRIFDISDATSPKEIAYFVPETPPGSTSIQLNDLTVDSDGLIYVTDRSGGGLYVLESEIGLG